MSTGYSILTYGNMITDKLRMEPYTEILQQTIYPGCVVVDIGAGTGIFSLLACRFGAEHVHCIEPDDAIQVAKEIASANGYLDKITFHQSLSTEVLLPQPADILISDLRGVLPVFQRHIPTIADARQRLLKSSGRLIPQGDTLWAALVEAPKDYKRFAEPWVQNDYGFDMNPGRKLVVNTWCKIELNDDQLLTSPQPWASLDYLSIESPNVRGEIKMTIDRPGTFHGIAVWFDTKLGKKIGFSTAPGQPKNVYGQAFFPMQAPVSVDVGDKAQLILQANLVGAEYNWKWKTKIAEAGEGGEIKANYNQSTFFGTPLIAERLIKRASHYVPKINAEGQLISTVFGLMNQKNTLERMSKKLLDKFPDRFSSFQEAFNYVAELSEKYSQS